MSELRYTNKINRKIRISSLVHWKKINKKWNLIWFSSKLRDTVCSILFLSKTKQKFIQQNCINKYILKMSTAILQSAALYDFGDIHMKVWVHILIVHHTVTPFPLFDLYKTTIELVSVWVWHSENLFMRFTFFVLTFCMIVNNNKNNVFRIQIFRV